jgi:hypothetical protein
MSVHVSFVGSNYLGAQTKSLQRSYPVEILVSIQSPITSKLARFVELLFIFNPIGATIPLILEKFFSEEEAPTAIFAV